MKYQVRRIGVLSAARVAFFLSWIAGILLGIVYGLLFLFASRFNPESFEAQLQELGAGANGPLFVFVGGFLLSIVYAFLGAITVGVLASLYNGLSRVIGGFSVELEGDEEPGRSSAPD